MRVSLFITCDLALLLSQVWRTFGEGNLWLDRRQKAAIVKGGHLTVFGIISCGDTILEEVEGFSPFMVSPPKIFVSLVSYDVLM